MRFALTKVVEDLQTAGFAGCAKSAKSGTSNVTSVLNVSAGTATPHDYTHAIWGVESGSNSQDEIYVRHALGGSALEIDRGSSTKTSYAFSSTRYDALPEDLQIEQWDVAAATDCEKTLVFLVTNDPDADDSADVGNSTAPSDEETEGLTNGTVSDTAQPGTSPFQLAVLYKVEAVRYYVDDNPSAPSGSTVRTLYRQVGSSAGQPLVDGVQTFNLTYGEDTTGDGNADTYSRWDQITTNARRQSIVSVRVALEVNDGLPIADATVSSAGVAEAAADFKSMLVTVRLRNRFGSG